MKKIFLLLITFLVITPAFYFCKFQTGDPNLYWNDSDRLILPFDSAKVLKMMNIVDSVNEVEKYIGERNSELFSKIDTLDLIDMHFACDCPNWRYADSANRNDFLEKDFYIEPGDEKLKLPGCLQTGRVQFIGREYGGKGYPKNPQFMDPNPPMGRVFKYYAYKIYKPFTVYGPEVESKTINDFEITELKVK